MKIALSGMLMFSMTGCLGGDANAENEIVELEFMQWWAAEASGEILEQIITDFEAENPNIKVELVTLPFGEVRTQAVAGQLSRSIPDIIAYIESNLAI